MHDTINMTRSVQRIHNRGGSVRNEPFKAQFDLIALLIKLFSSLERVKYGLLLWIQDIRKGNFPFVNYNNNYKKHNYTIL